MIKFYEIAPIIKQYQIHRIDQYSGWYYKMPDGYEYNVLNFLCDKKTKNLECITVPFEILIKIAPRLFGVGETIQFELKKGYVDTIDEFKNRMDKFFNESLPQAEKTYRMMMIKRKIKQIGEADEDN